MDENGLIRSAAQGDSLAWERLVRSHQESVFRLAYLLTGDPDDAEDIAQEAFMRAWRNLDRFDPYRPFRPWILSIASNLGKNRLRSAGRYWSALTRAFQMQPEDSHPAGPEQLSLDNLRAKELWRAVQKLNPSDQQIIYLRYFLDLSVAESAEIMQLAEGTVKSRASRALGKLRKVIEIDFPALTEGHEV